MAKLLEVSNVEFKGQVNGIESLWQEFHALVLPSRSEGLPLVILEAMAAGRPVIITNVGGSTEVVEEGVTGFIGHANEESFGDAMERAWSHRGNWEMMGKKASCYIARKLPTAPEEDFSKYINEIIND
jgi:glycosyltransferase involved in cell wall biosynthesis